MARQREAILGYHCGVVPGSRLRGMDPGDAVPADPYRNPLTGDTLFWGGARQFEYPSPIDVTDLPWLVLSSP